MGSWIVRGVRAAMLGLVVICGALWAGGLAACRALAADDLAAEKLPLWTEGAPGARGGEPADTPWLWLYPVAEGRGNGAAVVVCPGGGYGGLAIHHEGEDIARWWNERGVSAFVLKYRHAPHYQHPAPSQDASRAMRLVRHQAEKWQLDPARIGIMGFSAGGHLASTVATHFDGGQADDPDAIERLSSRPDFVVLGYPVISLVEPFSHAGSRRNLLGESPDDALVRSLSNELQVTAETPPAFLFHTNADTGVPPENSVVFYLALRRAKVPAEMHIYQEGPHGVGLSPKDAVVATWTERLEDWLAVHQVIPPRAARSAKK